MINKAEILRNTWTAFKAERDEAKRMFRPFPAALRFSALMKLFWSDAKRAAFEDSHAKELAMVRSIAAKYRTFDDFGVRQAAINLKTGRASFWRKPVNGTLYGGTLYSDANHSGNLSEAVAMWHADALALDCLIPLNTPAKAQLEAAYGELNSFLEAAE